MAGKYSKNFDTGLDDVHGLYETGTHKRNNHSQVFPMKEDSCQQCSS